MNWTSTQPAAITALVTAFASIGTTVADGPAVANTALREVLTIGWGGDPDEPSAADGTLAYEGIAAAPSRERFNVRCAILVLNGTGNITTARNRTYEILAAAGDVLAADPTIGGVVMDAHVSTTGLSQQQIQQGALATLAFSVECDAYTGR